MYELERTIFSSHGIDIVKPLFPYIYFDRYIYMCNPSVTHEELVDKLQDIKSQMSRIQYHHMLVFGATINLMKEFHYAFLTAMMKDAEFCDWIQSIHTQFEPYRKDAELLTSYKFN